MAAVTPSPSPSTVSSDFASALPNWLLIALLSVVTLVIVATFVLTLYSLSAPRSTLKNIIGRSRRVTIWDRLFGLRGRPAAQAEDTRGPMLPESAITPQLVRTLATSARSNKRTTRTTLAIVGFSLLGVVIVAIFGLSGQGVRDLRSQVIAAITTLVAAITGFYFGAETARNPAPQAGPPPASPGLVPDPKNPGFTEGQQGTYAPKLTGSPPPTVFLSEGTLPHGLQLNSATGVISGIPASGTAQDYPVTLTAKNGIVPDAILPLTLTVTPPAPQAPAPQPPAPEAPVQAAPQPPPPAPEPPAPEPPAPEAPAQGAPQPPAPEAPVQAAPEGQ